ncbi:MAG: molecular chaperone HtpG [bacterium]|nr:molecular chaperone HtpG [bacterium]
MTQSTENQSVQRKAFQADVKHVLDIVIHSLYTHREIFVRELISNAADALEKLRYEKLNNAEIADPDLPLEIRVDVDEDAKTVTISDAGIGMTEDEIVENLGSIAHSGSREFIQKLRENAANDVQLIGQFGVGFYSAFMAADEVTVQTRSLRPEARGVEWRSDGAGEYTLAPAPALSRGTRITLHLREDAHEFASKDRIKTIIRQYSNFVPFPILVNGDKVNTVQAIWTRNKSDVKDEEYNEFFKFIANEFQNPSLRLHFSADAPLMIHALLFVPQDNFERMGFGKMDPGVSLYCRKVLIQEHCKAILPEWMRFVKGVVDSEDLPLNISRETMQNNALVMKLKKVVTARLIKFFAETAEKEPEKYAAFWKTFGIFIKEGVATDHEYRGDLAPLLRFESSNGAAGDLVSLADYAARTAAGQNKIYYAYGPNRAVVENSPYMETFRKHGIEVLFTYEPVDEFVLSALREFDGKDIVPVDRADLDLPEDKKEDEPESEDAGLNKDEAQTLAGWFKEVLGDRVGAVRESKRLVDSPALLVNPDAYFSTGMQRIMKSLNQGEGIKEGKDLEINPRHPIMVKLARLREQGADEDFLKTAAEQILDGALIAAGLEADPRLMLQRNYRILERALED